MHSYRLHLTTGQMLPRFVPTSHVTYPQTATAPQLLCDLRVLHSFLPTSHPFPNSMVTSSRKPSQTSHKPLASLCHTEA